MTPVPITLARRAAVSELEQSSADGQIGAGSGGPSSSVGAEAPRLTRFESVLYLPDCPDNGATAGEPDFFHDLHLDQIVAAITAGKTDYDLKPFFQSPLSSVEAVHYRQEVMRDIQNDAVMECLTAFAEDMREMRRQLAQGDKLYYKQQKERWFLAAVESYCGTIGRMAQALPRLRLSSRGLQGLREYLIDYAESQPFTALAGAAGRLRDDLAAIRYCVLVTDGGFKVRRYECEHDYSAEVEATFQKFQQGAVRDYRVKFPVTPDMSHIEAKILEFVAQLYPEVFSALGQFCTTNRNYASPVVTRFDREIQFYISYSEFMRGFRHAGLGFCFPAMSDTVKEVFDDEGFDASLAIKLIQEKSPVVCNDFRLSGAERIFVVSGPNQGGKTTFARTFGQLHYLASIGCPVPGRRAQLFLFDRMFAHFEREEDLHNLRGKLQDDLFRIHEILARATPRSIIVMNEIFTSTTLQDAVFLAREVMQRIIDLDLLCVFVTFLDELASLSEKTVSMVSTVVPNDPAVRTFKVIRRPADGQAYAISIAEKYRVTYNCLLARIPIDGLQTQQQEPVCHENPLDVPGRRPGHIEVADGA